MVEMNQVFSHKFTLYTHICICKYTLIHLVSIFRPPEQRPPELQSSRAFRYSDVHAKVMRMKVWLLLLLVFPSCEKIFRAFLCDTPVRNDEYNRQMNDKHLSNTSWNQNRIEFIQSNRCEKCKLESGAKPVSVSAFKCKRLKKAITIYPNKWMWMEVLTCKFQRGNIFQYSVDGLVA